MDQTSLYVTPKGKRSRASDHRRRSLGDIVSSPARKEEPPYELNSERGLNFLDEYTTLAKTLVQCDHTARRYVSSVSQMFSPPANYRGPVYDVRSQRAILQEIRKQKRSVATVLESNLRDLAVHIKVTCFDTTSLSKATNQTRSAPQLSSLSRSVLDALRKFSVIDDRLRALGTRRLMKKILLAKNNRGTDELTISSDREVMIDRQLEYRIDRVIRQIYPDAANRPEKQRAVPNVSYFISSYSSRRRTLSVPATHPLTEVVVFVFLLCSYYHCLLLGR